MWFLLLLAAAALTTALPTESASPITIPLTRVKKNVLVGSRGMTGRAMLLQKTFGEQERYYGPGTIRNQTFQFSFETNTADVLVASHNCSSVQCSPGEKYDEGGKNLNKSILMRSENTMGDLYEDSVTVDGYTAQDKTIVAAEIDIFLGDSVLSGIIGLGLQDATWTDTTPFFQTLVQQGAVPAPEFGFYSGSPTDGPGNGAELVLGGRNEQHFEGPLTELPVVGNFWWTAAVEEVRIGGKSVANASRNNNAALINTDNEITGPPEAVQQVCEAIPGARIVEESFGTSCVVPRNMTQECVPSFIMGGRAFTLRLEDFLTSVPVPNEPDMVESVLGGLAITLDGVPNLWVVGTSFLRSWYVVYSHQGSNGKPSMLLAQAKE